MNPFKSKKGLGRGLSSLIGDSEKIDNKKSISISSLVRNKYQPRKKFDEESLKELTNSIKERGIIQPIIVRPSSEAKGKFEIIAGERRWQAAQHAGLHEVPIILVDVDNLKSLEFAIVENVQRKDLNPIEEAKGYKRLIEEFSYDHDKVSKFIGKSRAHVSNCLRLLSLPKEIIELIVEEKLSQGHAKILVGVENAQILAEKIIKKKLSVRQTESLIRLLKSPKKTSSSSKDPNILDYQNELQNKIGMRVFLKNKKNNTGTLTFEYKALDQLDRLIKIIKINY
ncbi:ParB/RepB/Spo0J family partition protein [Candidatus Pelagibacter sp.]|nr:ParB/RepB/Spo0J family partition protein [Candidatus Pelagibacter sp.]